MNNNGISFFGIENGAQRLVNVVKWLPDDRISLEYREKWNIQRVAAIIDATGSRSIV